jgi:protein-S-isoprenylcysteine O-methyltransferase Ste14
MEVHRTAVMTVVAMFMAMACVEGWKCRGNSSACLWRPIAPDLENFTTRLVGILGVALPLASLYWIFPEYAGEFYSPFFKALSEYWWIIAAAGLPLLWLECSKHPDPKSESEYKAGLAILELNRSRLSKEECLELGLTWLMRIFFLPVVFVYFCVGVGSFWSSLSSGGLTGNFEGTYGLLLMTESAFACVGYLFCTRLLGTHVRSVDKTAAGWVSALSCYPPFWSTLTILYLGQSGSNWVKLVEGNLAIQVAYSSLILIFMVVFTWSNISFGTRFSNLTHRGVVFAGPYRFFRHPAYLTQMIAIFLITVPFWGESLLASLKGTALFFALCLIYYARAKTEERNLLSKGREYRVYKRFVRLNRYRVRSGADEILRKFGLPGLAQG